MRQVQRAQIIQLAAAGLESQEIARVLGVSRPTVQLWRERFLALRIEGLAKDAPRPGRLPAISDARVRTIVEATLYTKPANATHWSVRTMAAAQQVSPATVQRIWTRYHLKPHLTKTFKLSRDRAFVEKLHDIVGLYLNPPDRALVLCVDETSQIQALDRTQPGLPLKQGRCGTRWSWAWCTPGARSWLPMRAGGILRGAAQAHVPGGLPVPRFGGGRQQPVGVTHRRRHVFGRECPGDVVRRSGDRKEEITPGAFARRATS